MENRDLKIVIKNHKHIWLLLLVILGFFSVGAFAVELGRKSPLIDVQYLIRKAEAGDLESQIRLVDFYSSDISGIQDAQAKSVYWTQRAKMHDIKDYNRVRTKVSQERADQYQKKQQDADKKMADMKKWMEQYKSTGNKQEDEQAVMMTAMKKMFGLEDQYSWTKTYSWRYRMTVNIQTPEGMKTASTVRELYFPPADKDIYVPDNKGIFRGEALAIDLGKRGMVFAIVRDQGNEIIQINSLLRTVLPFVGEPSRLEDVLDHYDRLKNVSGEMPPYRYPMFIHFRDLGDPQTVQTVYQRKPGSIRDMQSVEIDRFAEIFGEGVYIKNIIIEMTEDNVQWKLHETLKWLNPQNHKTISRELGLSDSPVRVINGMGYRNLRQNPEVDRAIESEEKKALEDSRTRAKNAMKSIQFL